MKSKKAQIMTKIYKIPELRFEDQQITSFSGLLIFQLLFARINLKQQLKKCFDHIKISTVQDIFFLAPHNGKIAYTFCVKCDL